MADKKASPNPISRGPIIVSRHGRPSLDRTARPRLDWKQYEDWWSRYEQCSLAVEQETPSELIAIVKDSDKVFSSVRERAKETADKATGGVPKEESELFNEAPLPPPRLGTLKFLPKTWNIIARTTWFFGYARNVESVKEARDRAEKAAAFLHDQAENGKIYLAAHGWFNRMLKRKLVKKGWKCERDGGDDYWSFRVYTWPDQ